MTKVITAAGIAPDEVGVWEVHEAFAAQALGVLRELSTQFKAFEVPDDRLNLNGAAVALGHPFGASGTRYLLSLAISMRERNARYGVLGLCAGSGRGMAVLLENSQRT
jgi:acetyl-CoA acetyltransferase